MHTKHHINEFIDYCLEAFFNGAVNLEEELPPGFSTADIESPEEFIKTSTLKEDDDALVDKDGVRDVDMDTMLQKKSELGGKADFETPYVYKSAFTVVDDNGKKIDLEKLKTLITVKPQRILTQNSKVQKSGNKTYVFYNLTLPAYKGLWYDEKKKEFKIVTTCPSAGECKLVCYARKGGYVQFPAYFTFSARILNFLLNDWRGFKSQLIREIKSAVDKNRDIGTVVIRWHDSGDFFNEKYLQIALDIAKETPDTIHYAYTKSVELVSKADKPKNFVFNYSKSGIEDLSIKGEDKKSVIVPKSIFRDLFPHKVGRYIFPSDITGQPLETLKTRLADMYNIPADSIITYKTLLTIPYNPEDPNIKPKYNVIVKGGDGDDSAMRKDVLTTMLFVH